jgi:putative ABC transport system substrate-binding protein
MQPFADAFVDQLRQLGWLEGGNLAIEWRFAEGRDEHLAELAAQLVQLSPDLIFAPADAVVAIKGQTDNVPIVMAFVPDPLALGLAKTLARPGANVTGTTAGQSTMNIKSVELLKAVLPQLSRLAVLGDTTYFAYTLYVQDRAQTAHTLGILLQDVDMRGVDDVERAFAIAQAWGSEAVLLVTEPSFTAGVNVRVLELAAANRLPAMYQFPPNVIENAGLMAFGVNLITGYRQGAEYVDKILRGAIPAELPIEEPRQFDFVVNIKAARALGITFPPDAAAQVTQWVQ